MFLNENANFNWFHIVKLLKLGTLNNCFVPPFSQSQNAQKEWYDGGAWDKKEEEKEEEEAWNGWVSEQCWEKEMNYYSQPQHSTYLMPLKAYGWKWVETETQIGYNIILLFKNHLERMVENCIEELCSHFADTIVYKIW